MSLVSVIIPYFKKKKFIEKTLNSVLNQTYQNFEIILIYDDENKNELLMVYVKLKTYSLEDVSKLALIINSHDFKVIETNPLNNYSAFQT